MAAEKQILHILLEGNDGHFEFDRDKKNRGTSLPGTAHPVP